MDKIITIDFETFWSQDYTLTKLQTEAYIKDPRFEPQGLGIQVDDGPTQYVCGPANVRAVIEQIPWDTAAVMAHNARFDVGILAFYYGIQPKFIFDTMSMAYPTVRAYTGSVSLAKVAQYFGFEPKKSHLFNTKGKRYNELTAEEKAHLKEYCMHDTWLCRQIFKRMVKGFPQSELRIIDATHRMFIAPVFQLDTELLEKVIKEEKDKQAALLEEANITDPAMLRSNKKFASLLMLHGVDVPMKTSPQTGKSTYAFAKTDLGFLELLHGDDELVANLCQARLGEKSTIEATRAQRLLDTGKKYKKLAVPLQYYAAHTGRYGGTEKINLQNLKRGSKIRQAIKAPPGYVVLAVDASQIEARVLAWLAEQNDLVHSFAKGQDVYRQFASKLFAMPAFEVTDDQRFVGKTCILGLGYGMSWRKFYNVMQQKRFDMDDGWARLCVSVYRKTFSRISDLWSTASGMIRVLQGVHKEQRTLGPLRVMKEKIELPNGMFLQYRDIHLAMRDGWDEAQEHYRWGKQVKLIYGAKIIENIVQALSRILTFDAMLRCIDMGYIPRLQVHDELVFVVPENKAEKALADVIHAMTTLPPGHWGTGIPLAAEGGYGKSYAEAK